MKKYKYLLFDADDTLLDFQSAERNAFYRLLEIKGIEPTPLLYRLYSDINQSIWEKHEKGLVDKDDIGYLRYFEFLRKAGISRDAGDFNETYRKLLFLQGETVKDADAVCARLRENGYIINVITNGYEDAQRSRFSLSGIEKYIDRIFISECLGVQKPKLEFFDKVFEEIGCFDKSQYLVIGDSLTSDILGGINAGTDTCWYNSRKCEKSVEIIPTYTINSLIEIIDILL